MPTRHRWLARFGPPPTAAEVRAARASPVKIALDPHRRQPLCRRGSRANVVGDGPSSRPRAAGRSLPAPLPPWSSMTSRTISGWPTHRTPVRHPRVATGGPPTVRAPTNRSRSLTPVSNRRRTLRRSRGADAAPSVVRTRPDRGSLATPLMNPSPIATPPWRREPASRPPAAEAAADPAPVATASAA